MADHAYGRTLSQMLQAHGQTPATLTREVAGWYVFYASMRCALGYTNSPEEVAAFARVGIQIPQRFAGHGTRDF